ncbi:MAG: ribonuclease Z [Bacteroidia bacterium]|nr:ribonuclease Z [Bacteroidia bacterium]
MPFSVTILGSSGALPAYGRFPSAQYVNIQNRHFLIDCGEGTQMQLMRYQIPYQKISHIFISHLHGDHYLGLMGLLFTMHLLHRENDLHLYAPKGLDEIITLQLKHSNSTLRFNIVFHDADTLNQKLIFEDDALTIETIPLIHKIKCCGFLFREKQKPHRIDKGKLPSEILLQHIVILKSGKDIHDDKGNLLYKNENYTILPHHSYSYAYCSDTAYTEQITEQIRGVDLLYHEATFMEQEKDKATETKHSTARQAAAQAKKAGVEKLIIGHFSARYKELQPLLEEAQSIFPKTMLVIEGETIDLDV